MVIHNNFSKKRKEMIENQLKNRGIYNEKLLKAFNKVPREKFLSKKYRKYAYSDRPLPIEEEQTISQPYIVAEMLQILDPQEDDILLEIGTGSGYAAAVASCMVKKVYGVERHKKFALKSKKRFADLNYDNITIKVDDGSRGWEDKSPFDIILVSAAATYFPENLLEQLSEKGRMMIPIGTQFMQELMYFKKEGDKIKKEKFEKVRFVPLVRDDNKNI